MKPSRWSGKSQVFHATRWYVLSHNSLSVMTRYQFLTFIHAWHGWLEETLQSLAVADKTTFRNCLVAMRPKAKNIDIPSSHIVNTYIHNQFADQIKQLKTDITVGYIYSHQFLHSCPCSLRLDAFPRQLTGGPLIPRRKLSWASLLIGSTCTTCPGPSAPKSLGSAESPVLTAGITSACILLEYVIASELSTTRNPRYFSSTPCIYYFLMVIQLYTITADNTSNNDTMCVKIDGLLQRRDLIGWSATTQRLPYVYLLVWVTARSCSTTSGV